MKSIPLLVFALATAAMAADNPPEDLLRFTNDDQLHGRFDGFENGSIAWQRRDVANPINVDSSTVRQIVLHGGRPARGIESTAFARLVGGDRVPGTIVSLDDKTLTLDTPYAGRLSIPRNHIDALAPAPFGGIIRYAGPFTAEGWVVAGKMENPDEDAEEKAEEKAEGGEKGEDKAEALPSWVFARTAWYSAPPVSNHNGRVAGNLLPQAQNARKALRGAGDEPAYPRPLILDKVLKDAASLRFHLAWRNQLGLDLAFQADFADPPDPKKIDPPQARQFSLSSRSLAGLFGNSYVLSLASNYGMLYACGFDKDGEPFGKRMQNTSNRIQLSQAREADIELRFDRRSGLIMLFINGEFREQWTEDPGEWAGKGSGIAFRVKNPDCQARISDVLVTDWNGNIDSARSMEARDRDVVLLVNGTDRFSGKVESIQDNLVAIKGSYATMQVPLDEIAEIHFARESLAEMPEPPSNEITLHLHPLGRLSGKPLTASSDRLSIASPHFGDAEIQLDFVNLLDFQSTNSFIDEWDFDF